MLTEIQSRVADGLIRCQHHGSLPLTIYNYAERVQYDRLWDDVTLQCRGLVMHNDKIVARPFRKFFNDTEHQPGEIPWHLPCEVAEKLDGSLLIAFHFEGEWQFATRGSFDSEQAARGREIFLNRYDVKSLDPACTYLCEVIYPQNRIVVNYGNREDVILLAVIETETGREHDLSHGMERNLTLVRRLPPDADAKSLRSIIRDDEEGYVVRFANGFRMKIKGQRYMELHRVITGVSSRSIWEALSEGKPFDEMLAVVPDEFAAWVLSEKGNLELKHDALKQTAERAFQLVKCLPDRKSQAITILKDYKPISSAVFALLDGKPVDGILWKQLYPDFYRPEIAARIEA